MREKIGVLEGLGKQCHAHCCNPAAHSPSRSAWPAPSDGSGHVVWAWFALRSPAECKKSKHALHSSLLHPPQNACPALWHSCLSHWGCSSTGLRSPHCCRPCLLLQVLHRGPTLTGGSRWGGSLLALPPKLHAWHMSHSPSPAGCQRCQSTRHTCRRCQHRAHPLPCSQALLCRLLVAPRRHHPPPPKLHVDN